MLSPYWPNGAPRGRVVTRFPESRQEGEKQNKPERAFKRADSIEKGTSLSPARDSTRAPGPSETCILEPEM